MSVTVNNHNNFAITRGMELNLKMYAMRGIEFNPKMQRDADMVS